MTQHELHLAISRTTGDCLRAIQQRGFSLLTRHPCRPDSDDPERAPQVVDWDWLETERLADAVPA